MNIPKYCYLFITVTHSSTLTKAQEAATLWFTRLIPCLSVPIHAPLTLQPPLFLTNQRKISSLAFSVAIHMLWELLLLLLAFSARQAILFMLGLEICHVLQTQSGLLPFS